jgi:ferrochelatase
MPENGVLLVNLGTPEAPTRRAVGRFLSEFLSDARVVDLPRWWWLPLLRLLIVPLRSGRTAAAYREVWLDGGSPLLVYSTGLAKRVQRLLTGRASVRLAMRYGNPSIASQLAALREEGVNRLAVLPMYPQYSVTTTQSVFDAVAQALERLAWQPELHVVSDYHDNPGWLHSVAASIRSFQARFGRAYKLLFSMHGIPRRLVAAGDVYEEQCRESVAAIAGILQQEADCLLAYQSRVGREEWLDPYTDEAIVELAQGGVRHLQVISPGFATDCLETLEEIAIRYRDLFIGAGGEKFEYIPALNDSTEHAGVLVSICDRILATQEPPAALV